MLQKQKNTETCWVYNVYTYNQKYWALSNKKDGETNECGKNNNKKKGKWNESEMEENEYEQKCLWNC